MCIIISQEIVLVVQKYGCFVSRLDIGKKRKVCYYVMEAKVVRTPMNFVSYMNSKCYIGKPGLRPGFLYFKN